MAVPVVAVTGVSTADAATTTAPFKVSRDTSKDDLTYTWTITGIVKYWQERVGGSLRTNGTVIRRRGNVCGMSCRCGGAGVMPMNAATGQTDTRTIDIDGYLTGSDGSYRFGLDAINDDGWSSTS